MNLGSSKKMKGIAVVFLVIAILSLLGGVFVVTGMEGSNIQTAMMWFISGALWAICGIILLVSAKLKKAEEDKKPKINAFNYGKKKLHKKAK